MSRRLKKHEEHQNHEAWAIPYADLVTLLFAFFVVMYALSSINEGKYRLLSDSLFAAFRGTPRSPKPIQAGDKQVGSGADIQTTIVQQAMLAGQPRSLLVPVPLAEISQRKTSRPLPIASKLPPSPPTTAATASAILTRVAAQVELAMDDLVKKGLVVVRRSDFWIEVEIRTDILFPSGGARPEPYAVSVIEQLADILAPFENPIRVEGHTDNVPIKTAAFGSNWELSAARAASVVRLLSKRGVVPARLAIIGFGEYRPMASNDTLEGRNANRRVEIVILSTELAHRDDPAKSLEPSVSTPTASREPAQGAMLPAGPATSALAHAASAPRPRSPLAQAAQVQAADR
jgi:chemotaxis protein MotB